VSRREPACTTRRRSTRTATRCATRPTPTSSGRTRRGLASWNTPIDALKVSAFYAAQKTHADDLGSPTDCDIPEAAILQSPPANVSDPHLGAGVPEPARPRFAGGNAATCDFGWAATSSQLDAQAQLDRYAPGYAFGLDTQNQTSFFNMLWNKLNGYTEELRLSSPGRRLRLTGNGSRARPS
jgi:hypothetical protein